MSFDDLDITMDELMEDIESAAIELYSRANIEALCQVFGAILHGIVCSDYEMQEEEKAAYIAFTIGAHLTSVAISHFPSHDIEDRLKVLFAERRERKVH